MIKLLLSHDDPHNGTRLFEALSKEGHKVATMNLYFEIKEKFEDLPVIVYKAEDFGAVDRIKGAIAEALTEVDQDSTTV